MAVVPNLKADLKRLAGFANLGITQHSQAFITMKQAADRIAELEKALAPIAKLIERHGGFVDLPDAERVGIISAQDAIRSSIRLEGLESKDKLTAAHLRYAAAVMKITE